MPPAEPGTYILLLRCTSILTIRIGRLGTIRLYPGSYLYIGSVPWRDMRARSDHHRHRAARPHWHADYLRRYTRLESVWYASGARCEHDWAGKVAAMPGAAMVVRRFGSSDCRVPGALVLVRGFACDSVAAGARRGGGGYGDKMENRRGASIGNWPPHARTQLNR